MRIFIVPIDCSIWDAIVNGPYVPKMLVDNVYVDKPLCDWFDVESKKAQYDSIAKSIITSLLNLDEFFRVSQCTLAKEMWNILEVMHEGTSDVKRARKHALIQEYELFRMKSRETIVEELARTLLNGSKLPKYFWANAINIVCYVLNHALIITILKKTPCEFYKGRNPILVI